MKSNTDSFVPFDVPAMSFTVPLEIDERARIVGSFSDAQGQIHGFIAKPKRATRAAVTD
jgi:hypothetical protein